MLYTPLLPEAASGTLEPRHVVVPLRQMCPHADLVLGHATALDLETRTVTADTIAGPAAITYERLVVALGAVNRVFPVPGPRRARPRLQGSRRRHRASQPRPAAARRSVGRRPRVGARVRVRRRGLRRRRGARGAQRPRARRAPLLPGAARREAAVGARRRGSDDPGRHPPQARHLRRPQARATRRRDPRQRDAHLVRRRDGRPLGRHDRSGAHARLDGRREGVAVAPGARPAARRSWPRAGRRDATGRGARQRLVARRLRCGAEHPHARARPILRPASTPCARRDGSRRTSPASHSRTATGCSARSRRSAASRASPT